ncbi:Antilisterial bacteriocin subtilosin biosynthesis protein AlbA [Thalassoglobus neptunius]|uniref:Antilisterial bacteriocin subtilosin biosynthesis protein AlbA n=1 Tax=Thalassoglobus neptunius TaxID=1938619 RepID=A0A5C5WGA9_9PLAN|nr:radical SAM protein [Thalassoglobus neptunius]TWT49814.1 Antilisterial bacteriocin subtilosin biosynthesis protein AlbA [Thalassoglobus neptunius]
METETLSIERAPQVEIKDLDELWFQVAGTLCNLECHHCFISCSPKNDSFGFLSLAMVRKYLLESVPLGVKEYYFTGGEPFLNREMVPILEETLTFGPATVLTNGTVLKDVWLERLQRAEDESGYTLEFRVSIDGPTPEINDPIRGERTFERAMKGVEALVRHGFLPIITMTRTWEDHEDEEVLSSFRIVLADHGYDRPRLKLLPRLKIGAESQRTCGYETFERVDEEMMKDFDSSILVCSHSRLVSDRGVHVCPILVESPDSVLGTSLKESLQPFEIVHGACFTCYQYGSICTNPSSSRRE